MKESEEKGDDCMRRREGMMEETGGKGEETEEGGSEGETKCMEGTD